MKRILQFAVLLIALSVNAQNKIAERVSELQRMNADFKAVSVLSPASNTVNTKVNSVVDGATLATLDVAKINEIVSNQYGTIELKIPYQNQEISILMYKVNPFVEGFHVDTYKDKNIPYQKGVYYRGIINGETNSVSAFNFFNGEFNGIVSSSALGNVVVGKLDEINNQLNYIVYSDAKMKVPNGFDCHTKDDVEVNVGNNETNRDVNSDRCVAFYFEIDHNIFLLNNSDTTTTTNWMTSVFNNVQTLFNADGISTGLKSIFVWTDPDPYDGVGTTSAAYLGAFAQTTPIFDGDVGQLIGIDDGGLGGVAYLNTICTSNNYSYSDINGLSFNTVPTYSWTVQVITHEFGHSLGSRHTHACAWNGNNTAIDGCGQQAGYSEGSCAVGPIPSAQDKGSIMSYCHLISSVGISFNNGFGPQPGQLIVNNVNSKLCLSLDCVNTCYNTVSTITLTNVTSSSAVITWEELGTATSWEVAVTPFSSSSIVWTTVTTNTYSVSNLSPNAYYIVRVRPLCDNITPVSREQIFATQAVNYCAIASFSDTGGTSGNYTNMENWTRTMSPNGNGLKIRATFTSFNLENNYDYLYIYNGPDEFSGEMTGGLTGTTLPGTFTSTSPEGSLTFRFYSDEGVVATGWNAQISCTGTLGVEEADFIDYSYYPNPTNGRVNITSKDPITEVTVYNVQGQLLFNQKLNELATNVDMSAFAAGTYFFKLKINGTEANFKILKM